MEKIVYLGTKERGNGTSQRMGIFCKIVFAEGRLSITGVEGPKSNGDCWGSWGQINMTFFDDIASFIPAEGWNIDLVIGFMDIWGKYHLNDMQAGTPKQTAWLRAHPEVKGYEAACEALADADLNPDGDYSYGSSWLSIKVPSQIIAYLVALPASKQKPAWV